MTTDHYEIMIACSRKGDGFDVQSHDMVTGSSLTEVLSKLMLVVAGIEERVINELRHSLRRKGLTDEDIPF